MKSVERFHATLKRSILCLSNFKNSNFLPKLISIYVFSLLLFSVVFIPTSLVIHVYAEEDEDDGEDDDEDNDDEDGLGQDSNFEESRSSTEPVENNGNVVVEDPAGNVGEKSNENTGSNTAGVNTDSDSNTNDGGADVNDGSYNGNGNNNADMSTTEDDQSGIVNSGNVPHGVNTDSDLNTNNGKASVDEISNPTDKNGMKESIDTLKENIKKDNGSSVNDTIIDHLTNKTNNEIKQENSQDTPKIKNGNNTTKKFVFNKTDNKKSDNETNTTEQPNIEKSFESKIGEVNENEKISVETPNIEKTKTCIQKVDFTPSKHQKNVKLQVSNLKEKPDEVQKELNIPNTSKVYKYLDIKLTSNEIYIGETGIKNMTFSFSVEKSWIENQSFDKFTVKMMRYHADEWQELNTSYTNETEDLVYYTAETPGLSIFAVVGNKVVEDSDEIVVESSHMPWWMPASVIFASTVALGVVLVKKRFVYTP